MSKDSFKKNIVEYERIWVNKNLLNFDILWLLMNKFGSKEWNDWNMNWCNWIRMTFQNAECKRVWIKLVDCPTEYDGIKWISI